MKKSFGMRVLSGLTSVLLAVSNLPSLVAGAAKNLENTPDLDLDDVTLLIGDNMDNPYRGETVEQTIQNYTNHFALGIASQFSVFVSDYYVPHQSDAEGRMAIGSYFESQTGGDYQIGKGNYGTFGDQGEGYHQLERLLETDSEGNIIDVHDYARIIWGAKEGTYTDETHNKTYTGPQLKGVGWETYNNTDENNIAYTDQNNAEGIIKNNYGSDKYKYFYATEDDLIDFEEQFATLQARSNQISKAKNQFEVAEVFKSNAGGLTGATVITLRYSVENPQPTETVYLNLDADEFKKTFEVDGETKSAYEWFKEAIVIRYENIPRLSEPRWVIQSNGSKAIQWLYSYIVVNDSSSGDVTVGWQNDWSSQYTTIRGVDENGTEEEYAINVSAVSGGAEFLKSESNGGTSYKIINADGTSFEEWTMEGATYGDHWTGQLAHLNNEAGVTSLLYNFPNADRIIIVSSTQGTILAPKAHTTDAKFLKEHGTEEEIQKWGWVNDSNPHLSGALIAKSFEGNIEFGFRPFTGPVRMLGATAGSRIAITKTDADDSTYNVPGATFGIFALKNAMMDEDGNILHDEQGNVLFIDGDVAEFEDTPTETVDTSHANEDFINLTSGYYVLKEISAPDGYAITEDKYYFIVEDKDYTVYLKKNGSTYEEYLGEITEDMTDIITVTFPKTTIIICKDETFNISEENVVATYEYSAFRAAERTYYYKNGTINFTIIDEGGSVVPSGISGAEYTDENGVKTQLPATEWDDFVLVQLREELGGTGYDPTTGKFVKYAGYIVIYTGDGNDEVLQPIITLTRVIKQETDNDFEGFIFKDNKILTIKKIDAVTKQLMSGAGAEIQLWCDGNQITDDWKWDDATGQIQLSKVEASNGYTNIYRLIESNVPEGYEDPTEDTIFAVIGNNLYISTVTHGEEIPADYFPVNASNSHWAVRDIMTTDDNETAAISSANRTIEVENKKKGMSVVKTDGTTPISGAILKLYAANGDVIGTFDFTESSAAQPLPEDSPYVDNGSLKPGTYYFEEVQEPSGYKKLTELVYFVVNDDLSVTAGKPSSEPVSYEFMQGSGWDNYSQYYLYNDSGASLNNWDVHDSLYIEKVEKIVLEFEQSGTEFNIQTTGTTISSNSNITAEGLYYTIDCDKNGNSPFTFNENHFEIQTKNKAVLKSITFYIQGEASGDDSGILKYENMTFKIKNEMDGYAVGISKVGSDKPNEFLAGAHFKLSKWNAETGQYEVVSGCENMESPDTLWTLALQEGKYKFEEIDAPEDYTFDTEPYYFEITSDSGMRKFTEQVETGRNAVIYDTDQGWTMPEGAKVGTEVGDYLAAEKISDGETYAWYDSITDFKYKATEWEPCLISEMTLYYADSSSFTYTKASGCWNTNIGGSGGWGGPNGWEDFFWNFSAEKSNITKVTIKLTTSNQTLVQTTESDADTALIQFKLNGVVTWFKLVPSDVDPGEITIIESGSPEAKTYYRIADPDEQDAIEITDPNDSNKRYYVEAHVEYDDVPTDVNTRKITFKVDHGTVSDTVEYDTLALRNTYKIGEEEYELTIVPDDADPTKAQVYKDGALFDLDGRLSVKKLDGEAPYQYVIFDNAEKKVLYPTFYDDNNLLLTKNLSNFDTLQDGLVIVNTRDTTRPAITISKIGSDTDGAELPGATLKLTYTGEGSLEGVTAEGAEITISGNTITWTTTGVSPKFTGLPDGMYTLEEVAAPSGYLVAGKMTFEISGGKVSGKATTVTMIDERKPVKINKVDINIGAELAGAKLVLYKQNSDGSRGDKVGEWTSEINEVWEIILEDGDYVLVEEIAPDGYAIAAETTFTVENGEVKSGSVTSKFVEGVILVEDDLTEIKIGKITKDGKTIKNLPGAKMKLTYKGTASTANVIPPDGTSEASGTSVRAIDAETEQSWIWTSTKDDAVFRGLPDGHYVLEEITAPAGYEIAPRIQFEIVKGKITNVKVEVDGEFVSIEGTDHFADENTVRMFDRKYNVKINKTDITGDKELDGAKLAIYDKEAYEAYLKACEDGDENATKPEPLYEWISEDGKIGEVYLEDGEYVLVEEVAPDGYTITTDTEFTVRDGKVVESDAVDNGVILVKDSLSEIEISKKDFDNQINELSGATLKLTLDKATKTEDAEATLEGVTAADQNVVLALGDNNRSITWVSGEASVVFKGLPDGTYTLSEEAPPDGYDGLTEAITFEIKNGKIVENANFNVTETLITVFNTKKQQPGVEMPSTGGIGNARSYQMMGLGLTELTMIAFTLKKRRRNRAI